MSFKEKYIGDRKFYRMVLLVALPIMIQNGFTNFVNLLDNVMVGRIGTEQMSGVSIVNQLVFVYNLCIFGGFSGAGIFTAQYFGKGDEDGVRQTCRFKFILGSILVVLALLVFSLSSDRLISMFLNEGSDGNLEAALSYGRQYLDVMMIGLVPFMVVQALSSTLRECGETVLPMKAGIAAVLVNLVFNWILIFGNLGFRPMGVIGAAIATVLSRFVECSVIVFWMIRNREKVGFAKGLFKSLHIKKELSSKILTTGSPLLLNEALWSLGMSALLQCYSMRGLASVAGFNIANTILNVFKTVFLAFGNAIGIIVGGLMGAKKMDEAVQTNRKVIAFSVALSSLIALANAAVAPFFPQIYNTSPQARLIASQAILIGALFMPLDAYKSATYFTLRSGGRTWVTFFFDGGFIWFANVSLAFILSRYTLLSSPMIFFYVSCTDIIKVIVGYILVKKRVWLRHIAV